MMKRHKVEMPEDWNDHVGWDKYYEFQLARPKRDPWEDSVGSISVEELPGVAESLKARGWRTVWIPGCGLSPLAHLLAHLGMEVFATDASATAIQFQRQRADTFRSLMDGLGPLDAEGSFVAEVHDFRTEFRREAFDLIFNVKAIQAFPLSDVALIARVHALALRKDRIAYFDTINVQGERRDQLEQALEDGGFVVPLFKLNRWYRAALQETGIPHAFVLGQPMIPRVGEYANAEPKWKQDMAKLREISAEYHARLEPAQEAERLRIGPDTKVAQMIYSTG